MENPDHTSNLYTLRESSYRPFNIKEFMPYYVGLIVEGQSLEE